MRVGQTSVRFSVQERYVGFLYCALHSFTMCRVRLDACCAVLHRELARVRLVSSGILCEGGFRMFSPCYNRRDSSDDTSWFLDEDQAGVHG